MTNRSKNVNVAETSSSTLIENTQGSDTKIDETNLKAHVMKLYPDLFDGIQTIKNAVVHLRCGARCSPCSMFTQEGTKMPFETH